MYSIMGMIVFGDVKRNLAMNDYVNFETFTNAFMTLFVVATADKWNDIMQSYGIEDSPSADCIINPSYSDFIANGS